jgi:hypothetical protein
MSEDEKKSHRCFGKEAKVLFGQVLGNKEEEDRYSAAESWSH